VNAWLWAATVLLVAGLAPCLVVTMRSDALERLVGLELAGVVATVVLLVLAQGFGRSSYIDLALVLALLSFAGSLVFARFLQRWL
jgi:multisubunit Na+/H+ antiporter MnhF subunit